MCLLVSLLTILPSQIGPEPRPKSCILCLLLLDPQHKIASFKFSFLRCHLQTSNIFSSILIDISAVPDRSWDPAKILYIECSPPPPLLHQITSYKFSFLRCLLQTSKMFFDILTNISTTTESVQQVAKIWYTASAPAPPPAPNRMV